MTAEPYEGPFRPGDIVKVDRIAAASHGRRIEGWVYDAPEIVGHFISIVDEHVRPGHGRDGSASYTKIIALIDRADCRETDGPGR